MPRSEEDLKKSAERGAVLSIINEMRMSFLPQAIFKRLLIQAIGVHAELIGRQVWSDGDNADKVKKLERLSQELAFGGNIDNAIEEYLKME
jgi:hypothetical protein